jgi:hypothetical protein
MEALACERKVPIGLRSFAGLYSVPGDRSLTRNVRTLFRRERARASFAALLPALRPALHGVGVLLGSLARGKRLRRFPRCFPHDAECGLGYVGA